MYRELLPLTVRHVTYSTSDHFKNRVSRPLKAGPGLKTVSASSRDFKSRPAKTTSGVLTYILTDIGRKLYLSLSLPPLPNTHLTIGLDLALRPCHNV